MSRNGEWKLFSHDFTEISYMMRTKTKIPQWINSRVILLKILRDKLSLQHINKIVQERIPRQLVIAFYRPKTSIFSSE